MTLSRAALGFVLGVSVLACGCGKRGNPLPPLQRIPAAPGDFAVIRIDRDVYARFTVPAVNVDGAGPADVARVELYALTAERLPDVEDPADLRELATLVGRETVRRPLPPPPPPKPGMPAIPLPPPGPGVDPGAAVVMREALTADSLTPVALPEPDSAAAARSAIVGPLVAPPAGAGPVRYYFAVAVSPRGRYGPPTHLAPAPLGATSAAPPAPEITVDERSATIRWQPPADARGAETPVAENLLPSKPLVPGPPATTYDVYEVTPSRTADAAPVAVPAPLTPAPVGALEFVASDITLGTERCFVVRPVDILAGVHVRGPASPAVCASFADTFPPAPAADLVAVAVSGGISLIWNPSPAPDLAGYLVLRGEGPGATLSPLMTDAIAGTTYTDNAVRPGAQYSYAVVAVDKAGNRSTPSNTVEETARP